MTIAPTLPNAFIWRKLHSISGVFLVLYIIEHLLVNSQAALFIGQDGSGFIESVNSIHKLPYLQVIELLLLGVPIVIHMVYGIKYLRTSKINSMGGDGTTPYLPEYPRNRAYTWQRITSYILIFAIIAHVVHMRFIEYPTSARKGTDQFYMVRLKVDDGLYTLSNRLGVKLYTKTQIQQQKDELLNPNAKTGETNDNVSRFFSSVKELFQTKKKNGADAKPQALLQSQQRRENRNWIHALEKRPLGPREVIAVAPDFGTAELLMVRETFKMPVMLVLYTLFVLTTCFHAFNGLWTAMISWGVTLTDRSQRIMLRFTTFLMIIVAFMGLAAIWGTYWINLKQ